MAATAAIPKPHHGFPTPKAERIAWEVVESIPPKSRATSETRTSQSDCRWSSCLDWSSAAIRRYERLRSPPPNRRPTSTGAFGVYWVIGMDKLRMSGVICYCHHPRGIHLKPPQH